MANIPSLDDDLDIIQKQSERPNEDGLDWKALQKQFDIAPNIIKKFINEHIIPTLNAFANGNVATVNGRAPDELGNVKVEAKDVNALPVAGGTLTGPLRMGNNRISGLPPAQAGTDPIIKSQYDSAFHVKSEVILPDAYNVGNLHKRTWSDDHIEYVAELAFFNTSRPDLKGYAKSVMESGYQGTVTIQTGQGAAAPIEYSMGEISTNGVDRCSIILYGYGYSMYRAAWLGQDWYDWREFSGVSTMKEG